MRGRPEPPLSPLRWRSSASHSFGCAKPERAFATLFIRFDRLTIFKTPGFYGNGYLDITRGMNGSTNTANKLPQKLALALN